jgi:hypothetical protein
VGSLIFPALAFFGSFLGQCQKMKTKIISALTFFAEAEKK